MLTPETIVHKRDPIKHVEVIDAAFATGVLAARAGSVRNLPRVLRTVWEGLHPNRARQGEQPPDVPRAVVRGRWAWWIVMNGVGFTLAAAGGYLSRAPLVALIAALLGRPSAQVIDAYRVLSLVVSFICVASCQAVALQVVRSQGVRWIGWTAAGLLVGAPLDWLLSTGLGISWPVNVFLGLGTAIIIITTLQALVFGRCALYWLALAPLGAIAGLLAAVPIQATGVWLAGAVRDGPLLPTLMSGLFGLVFGCVTGLALAYMDG